MGDIFPVILRIRLFCNKHVGNVEWASPTLYVACVKTARRTALQTDVSLQARAHFSQSRQDPAIGHPLPVTRLCKPSLPAPHLLGLASVESTPPKHTPQTSTAFKAEFRCHPARIPHPPVSLQGVSSLLWHLPSLPHGALKTQAWGRGARLTTQTAQVHDPDAHLLAVMVTAPAHRRFVQSQVKDARNVLRKVAGPSGSFTKPWL